LAGAEIARSEEFKQGRTPLHTFRMDIDYASVYAMTVYGKIGLKVWICKGEVLGNRDLNPNFSSSSDSRGNRTAGTEARGGDRERGERRGGGDRGDRRGGGERGGERRGGGAGAGDRKSGGGGTRGGRRN